MREIKKVLIITNVPQDYRIAMLNSLNETLKEQNIQLKVVFAAAGYKRRKSKLDFSKMKFDYVFLKSFKFHIGSIENTMFTYPGIIRFHRKYKPDATFVIGYSPATIKLWLFSFFMKINYFIWSGSVKFKGRKDSTLRIMMRKTLVRRAKGFVAYGTMAKNYLMSLGASADKISIAINTVDTDFFNNIAVARTNRQVSTTKQLLYLGYLTRGKRIDDLIHTIYELKSLRTDFHLRIIGDGPDRELLFNLVNELHLNSLVSFEGFIQKKNLPPFLTQTDCFLFQTGCDIWGLVLNEAMASGLPCVVSPNAGAVIDLIQENENGIVLDFSQHEMAAQKLNKLLNDESLLLKLGNNANQFIRGNVTPAKSAQGFIDAINKFNKNA
ncbi:MAG: glycosyltransferase family 4 protein [Bacteroidetes bacterium]|jgi:glycosyltransferase involved in cell wall biosynthesis|nr:glycosyltransferase family 4 protein [Bacteroidota bacterium]